jgi:hypothetical protein
MERIGLREAIEAMRVELSESILMSEGKQLRFEVGQIELEFQITIENTLDEKSGIKLWAVELGGGTSSKESTVHKVKIPLKPVMRNGSPVLTGSSDTPD